MKTLSCYSAIAPLIFTMALHCFANDESIFVAIGSAAIGKDFIKTNTSIHKLIPTNEQSRQDTAEYLSETIKASFKNNDETISEESKSFAQMNGCWKVRGNLAQDLAKKINERLTLELQNSLNKDGENYEFTRPTEDEEYRVSTSIPCNNAQNTLGKISKESQERIPALPKGLSFYLLKSLAFLSSKHATNSLKRRDRKFQNTHGTGVIRHFFSVITKEDLKNSASNPIAEHTG